MFQLDLLQGEARFAWMYSTMLDLDSKESGSIPFVLINDFTLHPNLLELLVPKSPKLIERTASTYHNEV
jgi:hypothetical protein